MADHKIDGNGVAGNVQAPERIWASNRTNGNCVVSFTIRSEEYSIEYIRADVAEAELAAILALRDKPAPGVTVRDSFAGLIADARTEAEKAMKKFPQPNYVLLKVAEEAGEVVKAGVHFAEGRETRENVKSEMIQIIAMLYRLWVEGDQVNGVPPIAPPEA